MCYLSTDHKKWNIIKNRSKLTLCHWLLCAAWSLSLLNCARYQSDALFKLARFIGDGTRYYMRLAIKPLSNCTHTPTSDHYTTEWIIFWFNSNALWARWLIVSKVMPSIETHISWKHVSCGVQNWFWWNRRIPSKRDNGQELRFWRYFT